MVLREIECPTRRCFSSKWTHFSALLAVRTDVIFSLPISLPFKEVVVEHEFSSDIRFQPQIALMLACRGRKPGSLVKCVRASKCIALRGLRSSDVVTRDWKVGLGSRISIEVLGLRYIFGSCYFNIEHSISTVHLHPVSNNYRPASGVMGTAT